MNLLLVYNLILYEKLQNIHSFSRGTSVPSFIHNKYKLYYHKSRVPLPHSPLPNLDTLPDVQLNWMHRLHQMSQVPHHYYPKRAVHPVYYVISSRFDARIVGTAVLKIFLKRECFYERKLHQKEVPVIRRLVKVHFAPKISATDIYRINCTFLPHNK